VFKIDHLFSHDVDIGDMFLDLKPWLQSVVPLKSVELSRHAPQTLNVLALGYSGLGQTRA